MKITVCNNCGLTMHTGVFTCRRCNLKNLAFYEVNCDSDIYIMHRRLDELGGKPRRTPASPAISAIVVVAVAALGMIVVENVWHPDGLVAKHTKNVVTTFKPQPAPEIARKSDGSL